MLGDWAHEGPRPPSNLEESKGLKEAQHAAHSHPSRTRGAISASLEGSHRDPRLRPASPPRSRVANLPSSWQTISASLEGSEPTLEQATHLHFARGHPSAERTNIPAAHPSVVRRH